MRHLRKGKKLRRVAKQRKALIKALGKALIEHGRIKTTLPKAKYLRPYIEKTITRSKISSVENLRQIRKTFSYKTSQILIKKWGPLFKDRKGGYTRITRLVPRKSDASPMAYIEFIEKPKEKISKQ